ncbi:glycine zipper 2TM domain-containing protein [Kerstersia similis]|uniref:glycine zipper 2TM domain-containing protein n=1 Tax=Kerstersia similis TaxID=206505 RepID=UPI0039F05644
MIRKGIFRLGAVVMLMGTLAACSTWDGMSSREKSAVGGAAIGGAAGAVISDGGLLGTVGGAAIGGVVGDQVGKHNEKK